MEVYVGGDRGWYKYWRNEGIEGGEKVRVWRRVNGMGVFVGGGSMVGYGGEVE